MNNESLKIGSICAKETKEHLTTKPHILPIYATSSFAFDRIDQGISIFKGETKGHVYGRYGNPTIDAVAEKLGTIAVHGSDLNATTLLTSSGMSAISTVMMGLLKSGDSVLTQGNLYGGTTELLLKILGQLGIKTVFCDLGNLELVEEKLKTNKSIKMVYCETPANPTMALIDLTGLGALANKYQVLSVVDNTFCTPYLQQPLVNGIAISIHSTTKFLNGHGNSISGAIIGTDPELMNKVWTSLKLMGTNANPFDAWLLHNGLKTLALRMDQHGKNGMAVAKYLEQHPKVAKVNYNGLASHPDHELAKKQMRDFGSMLSFELKGGMDAGIKFMNALMFCTLAPTLGDVDTLVLHPASSSHVAVAKEIREANGITDGLIRLSIGIEEVEDIIADLEQALG